MTVSAENQTSELAALVNRCQEVMAHAWVVRAFLRHSDEIDDFPELTEICRAIFDTSRALETRVADPVGYFKMLNKKLTKFKVAVEEFAGQVPGISTHTNFAQAVISMRVCMRSLEESIAQARTLVIRPNPES